MDKKQFLNQLFNEYKARSGTRDGIVVRFGDHDDYKIERSKLPVLLRLLADILELGD